MPKTVTSSLSGSTVTVVTEIDGVKTTVTKSLVAPVAKADELVKTGYRVHKVWNPATLAFITVNCTGNEATDAAALAVAMRTAGDLSGSVISTT